MKSISDASDEFLEQQTIAKYLILTSNHNINKQDYHVKHEKLKNSFGPELNHHLDDFYYNMNELAGLNKEEESNDFENIIESVMKLFDNQMVVCDFLLVFCMQYCTNINDNENILKQFVNSLFNCVSKCLFDNNDNESKKEEEEEDLHQTRNYYYFKHCLLFSNVWLCKDSNDEILFKQIELSIDQELMKQKKFVWHNIEKEMQNSLK